MFLDVDCVQLEVNPLAETPQGKVTSPSHTIYQIIVNSVFCSHSKSKPPFSGPGHDGFLNSVAEPVLGSEPFWSDPDLDPRLQK
jgi:hypothetical protein